MTKQFLGIFREQAHSPNRVSDDYEILRLSAEHLTQKGVNVKTMQAQDVMANPPARPDVAFIMCEQAQILDLLKSWQNQGTMVINPIDAIWNTYRYRMIPLLQNSPVSMPQSLLLDVSDLLKNGFNLERKIWIKRGDVHNTQAGDVTRADNKDQAIKALQHFETCGIEQVVFQDHIDGDLIKFYGVGKDQDFWFRYFYHKDQLLKNYAFSVQELKKQVGMTAQKLGLNVFGGDAVVDVHGNIFIIDINAWPSFALFRAEAAPAIANFIYTSPS